MNGQDLGRTHWPQPCRVAFVQADIAARVLRAGGDLRHELAL